MALTHAGHAIYRSFEASVSSAGTRKQRMRVHADQERTAGRLEISRS